MNGRKFFVLWMLTFLGFPLGGTLALLVVGSVQSTAEGAAGGVLAGAVVGAAQWLVLRRYLAMSPLWIAATAVGLGVGDAAGAALTEAGTGIGDLAVTGVTAGLAVGVLQYALLRDRVGRAGLWVPVAVVSWPLGWTVTWAVGVDVERGYAVFGSTGALAFAAVTGAAMLVVLPGTDEPFRGRAAG